jgi:hypothetical protein
MPHIFPPIVILFLDVWSDKALETLASNGNKPASHIPVRVAAAPIESCPFCIWSTLHSGISFISTTASKWSSLDLAILMISVPPE